MTSNRGYPSGSKKATRKPKASPRSRGPSGNAGIGKANSRSDASSVTPDDFAAALQKAVDDLQTRLTSQTNSITNFAVKEFRLEIPVVVSVTRLGTFQYRFLNSGETADSSRVTRVSLTIVPIEKQSSAGALPPSLFTPDTTVDDLTGIDRTSVEILRQRQIYTVSDLWRIGSRANARIELGSLLKMDRVKLSNLLSEAELLLVNGIGKSEAQILFKIGIKSLSGLSKLNPEALAQKFNQSAPKKKPQLDLATAETWIKAARSYFGLTKIAICETPANSSVIA